MRRRTIGPALPGLGEGLAGWDVLIPDNAGPIVRRLMGLSVAAACDTAQARTRICSDATHEALAWCNSNYPDMFIIHLRELNFLNDKQLQLKANNKH